MKQFQLARIKLTIYYLLIITAVIGMFSYLAYQGLTFELHRGLKIQAFRIAPKEKCDGDCELPPDLNDEFLPLFNVRKLPPNPEIFKEIRQRVAIRIITLDGLVLIFSGVAGYFLAGKTLEPIEKMVEEQKQFISDASHELRTPLTAIKTEIEVALRNQKMDLKNAKKLLVSNLEEVNRMQTLSNYLLTLAKYQTNQVKLPMEKLNLAAIAQKAVKKISTLAKKKNITLKREFKKASLVGNIASLNELAIILLDNAIKYSRESGQIIIRTKILKNQAVLEVKDFGVGIKAAELPHIFGRFYRADSSRAKKGADGYGLGLAIAKSIVELHHGKIKVRSIYGKGSKFSVVLPVRC